MVRRMCGRRVSYPSATAWLRRSRIGREQPGTAGPDSGSAHYGVPRSTLWTRRCGWSITVARLMRHHTRGYDRRRIATKAPCPGCGPRSGVPRVHRFWAGPTLGRISRISRPAAGSSTYGSDSRTCLVGPHAHDLAQLAAPRPSANLTRQRPTRPGHHHSENRHHTEAPGHAAGRRFAISKRTDDPTTRYRPSPRDLNS